MLALLEYMYIEINCSSSSYNFWLNASLQKQLSSSQPLNYCVHFNAQFLQMDACSNLVGYKDNKSVFQSSWSLLNRHQSFVLRTLLLSRKEISALSLLSTLFQIHALPTGNKRKWVLQVLYQITMVTDFSLIKMLSNFLK